MKNKMSNVLGKIRILSAGARSLALGALLCVLGAGTAQAAGYQKINVQAHVAQSGGGKIYVADAGDDAASDSGWTSKKPSDDKYVASMELTLTTRQISGVVQAQAYLYAKANEFYEFKGWSTSDQATPPSALETGKWLTWSDLVKKSETLDKPIYAYFTKVKIDSFTVTYLAPQCGSYTVDGAARPDSVSDLDELYEPALAADLGSDKTLIGWFTTSDGGATKSYFSTEVSCKGYFHADTTVGADIREKKTGAAQALVVDDVVTLSDGSFVSAWTATSSDPSVATVTASGAAGAAPVITAKAKGSATVTVMNETAVWTYVVSVTPKPTDVTLCVGDTVQFYFYNTQNKTWSVYFNGSSTTGQAGSYVSADKKSGSSSKSFNVIFTANASGSSDVVRVSDGTNDYYYRFTVNAARTFDWFTTGSVTQVCAAKQANAWTVSTSDDAIATVTCQPATAAATTTASITGHASGMASITVQNYASATTASRELGAVYTLKTVVTGPAAAPVFLAPGASVTVLIPCAADQTDIVAEPSSDKGVSVSVSKAGATCVEATFACASDAEVGTETAIEITCGGEVLAACPVKVIAPIVLKSGKTAADLAKPAVARWEVGSSEASVATLSNGSSGTSGNLRYNVSATAGGVGAATLWATNAVQSLGSFGWSVTSYDENGQTVTMPVYSEMSVYAGNASNVLFGVWSAVSGDPSTVTAEVVGPQPTNAVTVKLTSGGVVNTTTVVASNAYHIETFTVNVTKPTYNTDVTLGLGAKLDMTESYAQIDDISISPSGFVDYELFEGKLYLKGLKETTAPVTVSVDGHSFFAIYHVTVAVQEIGKSISLALSSEGSTTFEDEFGSIKSLDVTSGSDVVNVVQNGGKLTFSGKEQGSATVTVVGSYPGESEMIRVVYKVNVKAVSTGGVKQFKDGYIVYDQAEVREDGDDLVFIFTNTDDNAFFIVPSPYMAVVDILAVGGGGAGGTQTKAIGGGGGGAGGFKFAEGVSLSEGDYKITVGEGGAGGSADAIMASAGHVGYPSAVTLSLDGSDYQVVSAAGGGGGGASTKGLKDGVDGGSGGGGTWFTYLDANGEYINESGAGGRGAKGTGWNGGTSDVDHFNCGGGGGGAGGAGGADGAAGVGLENAITGESVMYSVGGIGGRNDVRTRAADGVGYGYGGAGGNGGPGGAGANGVVIVRFSDLFSNVKVPIPTTNDVPCAITRRFTWESGATLTAFDTNRTVRASDGVQYRWSDVIDHIDGVVSKTCTGTPDNPQGLGTATYIVYLKDGFSWDDGNEGSYGLTGGQIFRWVVVANQDIIEATVEVTKTVSWQSDSNATVTIETKSTPQMSMMKTPNVLFLGTLCGTHGLKGSTIVASLNAITENGNVDYFLYHSQNLKSSGSLLKDEKIENTKQFDSIVKSSGHFSLNKFYEKVYESLKSDKVYDYIVFEFDGSRIALDYGDSSGDYYQKAFEYESELVNLIKPFYQDKRVVLVVDAHVETQSEPWLDDYWRPNTYCYSGSSKKLKDISYKALVGLFDPKSYSKGSTAGEISTEIKSSYYANDRYDVQTDYLNVDKLVDLLRQTIKSTPYNIEITDNIVRPEKGLTIRSVDIVSCTNLVNGAASEDPDDWFQVMSYDVATGDVSYPAGCPIKGCMAVDIMSNSVYACLSNINYAVFSRVETRVLDDGRFRSTQDAKFNVYTGEYEKDPNDGKAVIALKDDTGSLDLEADATTAMLWVFRTYNIAADADNGVVSINGIGSGASDAIGLAEGSRPIVYYRGLPGYEISRLVVNGKPEEISEDGTERTQTVIEKLTSEQNVHVEYESYVGEYSAEDITEEYDGLAHVFDVVYAEWGTNYGAVVKYARSADATMEEFLPKEEFCALNIDLKNVGEYVVYARIFVEQIGYGVDEDGNPDYSKKGWTYVTDPIEGKVTVVPRTVTVIPRSVIEPAGTPVENIRWAGVKIENVVPGEERFFTINTVVYGTEYVQGDGEGQYRSWVEASTTNAAVKSVIYIRSLDISDPDYDNYDVKYAEGVVNIVNGPIVFDGVEQREWLDPENPDVYTGVKRVEKPYDGIYTGLVIKVDAPDEDIREQYGFELKYYAGDSLDGVAADEWQEDSPQFLHVGTNKVWYSAICTREIEGISFFPVTNYQYVIIYPKEIVLESASARKRFDGTPLTTNEVNVIKGRIGTGDTLDCLCTGSQYAVGSSGNAFTWSITGTCEEGDYVVTCSNGTLVVDIGSINIGGVNQPVDPRFPLPSDECGAKSVVCDYSGEGTNIIVEVGRPDEEYGYTLRYTTTPEDPTSWRDDFALTNVCTDVKVYFALESEYYASVTNFAYVTIRSVEVLVRADDKTKRFGEPDPDFTMSVIPTNGTVVVTEAMMELITNELVLVRAGAGEELGPYVITFADKPATAAQGNCKVYYEDGTLTITKNIVAVDGKEQSPLEPTSPNDPEDAGESATGVSNVVKDYDGNPTNVTIDVTKPEDGYTIKYSTDDGDSWSENEPELTHAGTNKVWYVIEADGYEPVTNFAYVTIHAIPVTLKADSDAKAYDGRALTTNGFTVVSGAFVGDEGIASLEMTAASTITDVGSVDNVIDPGSLVFKSNTLPTDYVFSYEKGLLTVNTAEAPEDDETDDPNVYDPENPQPPQPPTNPDGTVKTLSDYDYVGVYDAAAHTLDTNALWTVLGGKEWYASSPSVSYSVDGSTWVDAPYEFTDVVATSFWYKVSAPNFSNYVHSVGVTITQRVVTVTADSATKAFDGTALTTNGVTVTSGSFAGEEGIASATMDADSTITDVGVTNNTIASVTYKDNTKATNYSVSFEKGTLEVTAAEAPEEDDPDDPNGPFDPANPKVPNPPENNDGVIQKLSDYDYVGVYDAEAHTLDTNALWTAIGTNEWYTSTPSVSYSLDGTTWVEDPFEYTDVVATSFWYKVSADNFEDYVHSVGVTITQRVATVTAASAAWVYDAESHSTNGFTSVGFVDGEGLASVTMTAASKITEKGSVSNEIESVTFKPNTKESNYTLVFEQGKLKVTDATIEVGGKPQDPDDPEDPLDPEDDGDSLTGVSNVVKDYDGQPTNIVIDVTKPEDSYTIKYSTDGGTTYTDEEPSFTDAGTNDVWYVIEAPNFAPVTNHAYVTIHPIAVTITAASASKTYDGTALATNGYAVAGFIAGEGVTNATMTAASTITAVGVVSNELSSVDYAENTKASNYVVTFKMGELTVLTAALPDPEGDDPDKDPKAGPFPGPDLEEPAVPPAQTNNTDGTWSKLSDYDVVTVYDGEEHTFDVTALSNKLDTMSTELCNNPYELSYSLTGEAGSWQNDPFRFTDVTETPTSFWYRVEVPNFTNYIHAAGVVITQRVATVVSADGSWTYDGQAHTTNDLAVCEGFVAGETYTTNWVGTITTVGTTNNDFAIVWDGTAKESNYTLVAATGVLEVVTAELPDPEDSEDPDKDPEAGPFPGPDLEEPTTPPAPTNNVDGTWSKLSDYDVVTVYDGEAHTFDVTALSNKLANTQLYGNPYTLSYSMTGKGDWQTDPFYFTNVTETPTSFWYRVAVPNFTNYIHAAGVVITQRVVEVTSQDGTWTYDGKAHGTNEVYVSNGSFAAGEGVSTNGFPTITEVGTTNNEFEIVWDNADPANYCFSVVTGTLEIVAKDGGDGSVDFGELPGTPYYYDGEGHEPKPVVHDDEVGRDLVEGVDFTYVWEENTNATETAKVIANFIGNYTGAITNDFTILPRSVTLTSGSGSWTYDGEAHGTNEVTATAYADPNLGFVAGEGVTTNSFATYMTVTNGAANSFAWEFLPNTFATNYTVTVVTGTIDIVTAELPDPENPEDPDKDPAAGPFPGPDLEEPTTPPAPTNNTDGTWSKLSDYDVVTVYDGEAHTFDVAALSNKLDNAQLYGNPYTLSYSMTGKGDWQTDPFYFTDVTETPTSFWYRVTVPNFTNYIHAAGVVITQRVVEVTSQDGTWTYDGKAHGTNEVYVSAGSFADGEGIATNDFATITEVGTTNNEFSVVWDNADPENYSFSVVTGTLKIVQKDGGDGSVSFGDLPGTPYYYDGNGHEPKPTVHDDEVGEDLVEGVDFTYVWEENTNATETAKVIANFIGNYTGAITNDFTILPRSVTLTSGSGSWTYDGEAHGTNEVSATAYADPNAGFVAGEGVTTNGFLSYTTVTNGAANSFAWEFLPNTFATNYTVTVVTGTIDIVTAKLPDPEDDDPDKDPEAGPFPGPDLEEPTTPPAPTNNTDGTWSKLSDYDVVTVYDGEEHTFDVAALSNKLDNTQLYGNPYTLSYSMTGKGDWQTDPFYFTDVTETPTSFWYRVTVPNFTNYIHAAGVVITQRVVEVTSGTEEWTYDGEAHSNLTVTVSAGSFASGEGIATNDFATITDVGTNDNTFAYSWIVGDESNYLFTVVTGEISVVSKDGGNGDVAFEPITDVLYYSGEAKEPTVTLVDDVIGYTLVKDVDYTISYADNTNATEMAQVTATFIGNYSGSISTNFTILPRSVTLTSGSGSWTYDGEAHGTNEVVATAYADPNAGFVAGEGVTTNGFLSYTTVTNGAANSFAWEFLPNTFATNYTVTVVTGTIDIVTAKLPDPEDDDPDKDPEAGPFPGPDLEEPTTPPAPTNNTDGTWSKLSDYDVVTVYDGEEHTFDVAALSNKLDNAQLYGNPYTLSYSMTGKDDWQTDPFYFTDVTETPTSFWYRVAVPNFTNYIHAAGVVITQRVATVESESGSWTYDGQAHATNDLAVCEGFVAGETYTTNWVGTITEVGTTNNDFTVVFDGTAKESNYTLVAATGTLEVVTAKLPDPEDDDPDKDPKAGPFPGPDLEEPAVPPVPTNNVDGTWSKLSDYDWIGVYDGEAHTFDVTALSNKLDSLEFYGNPYTLSYSLTGAAGTWQDAPFYFTNVDETPTSFWYRVTVDNFSDYIHAAGVVITQRVVTIVFPEAEKVFDGTTDAQPVMTNLVGAAENMVGSEEFDAVGEGVFDKKSVGTRSFRLTSLEITPQSGARFPNYLIRYGANGEYTFDPGDEIDGPATMDDEHGPLPPDADLPGKITGADPEKVDGEDEKGPGYDPSDPSPQSPPSVTNELGEAVTLSDYDYVGVYDGESHTIDTNGLWASVNEKEWLGETPVVEYSIDGTAWQEDPFEYTDAVATSFWYRVYADNFKTNVHSVGVTITQRVVTVVFPSATKVFDGTPDCDPLVTNVVGEAANMVGEERFDATANGGFLDDCSVGDDRDFVITSVDLVASNGAKYQNYRIFFGANGEIEFLPTDVPEDGPASFGPKDRDPNFPADDDPALRLPGEILECAPHFAAELQWGFNPNTGIYFAQLKVTCLNTTDTFDFTKGSMRFDFQDRVEDGTLKLGLWDAKKNQALSKLGQTETLNGTVYSTFPLADPDASDANGGWAPGVSHTYGPADLSAKTYTAAERLSTPAMRVYTRNNPKYGNEDLVIDGEDASVFIGWLVWEWTDAKGVPQTATIPVTANKRYAELMASEDPLAAPLTTDEMNLRLAAGVTFDDPADVVARLTAFAPKAETLTAALKTVNEKTGEEGVPGVNARIAIRSAATPNGTFEKTGSVTSKPDGSFEFGASADQRFFRFDIEVVPVVK